MKAHFHREGLLNACQLASVAVAPRDVKPILRNLKLILEKDRGTLMATDLELGIRLEVRGVKVKDDGAAILPSGRIIAILREGTDDEVQLEADTEHCTVRGQHTEFEMAGDDPGNFPDVPVFSEDKYHELTAGTLREMIRRTVFAAADASPRYALTGVLWELDAEKATLVATDGRRLAVIEAAAAAHGGHHTKGTTPVVPTKAMGLLERLLTDPEEVVRVSIRPNEVLFKTEKATLYSRLVEGRYPAYREVFPKNAKTRVALTAGPFLSAVKQSAIMTDEESKRVTFHFDKNKLTMQARGAETGSSRVEVPIEYDAKAIDINFDPKFLVDMLRVLEPDTALTLHMADGNSPAHFQTADHYSYVVMPLS
ncbi:MAG: DNA polymerase III subunit beta [Gemmataceae bacterium]